MVRIFPHSDWIRTDMGYLSIFNLNAGKEGPEKLQIWILFTQCQAAYNKGNKPRGVLKTILNV